jgi:hypothetical protein
MKGTRRKVMNKQGERQEEEEKKSCRKYRKRYKQWLYTVQ